MEIKQNLVPQSKYSIKCPYTMTPIGICVHNTANDAPAENEVAYMVRNDNKVSFHFAVDGNEIWQGIPLDRNAWHAGDGNGDGNRKHIGIEICYSLNGGDRFTAAEKNAAKFIAELLKERDWGIDRVKKHQDFSGKYCPHRTLDMGWQRFLDMIQAELDKLNKPTSDVLYCVQTGAFAVKDNATALASELNSKGYNTYIVCVDNLYKVQVGAFAVRENADSMLAKVKGDGYSAFVTEKSTTETPKPTQKSIDELAREVLDRKWGNGTDRKNRLTAAGYDYDAVQKKVNELCKK